MLWITPVLMMYEHTTHLTLRNLSLLGQVAPAMCHFDKDRTKYLTKLRDFDKDKITRDADRVWPAGTEPGDHVQAMFEVVAQATDDLLAARSGSGQGAFSDIDELVNGLKGHEAGGVKQRDIEGIVATCRVKKMLTLPGSDTSRPGKGALTLFKLAFDPKDKPGAATLSPRLSWPTLVMSSVDNEAGQTMLKEGSDVAATAATYGIHFRCARDRSQLARADGLGLVRLVRGRWGQPHEGSGRGLGQDAPPGAARCCAGRGHELDQSPLRA